MSSGEIDEGKTRKQRRDQARTQRRELEQAEAAGANRRRRLQLLGGALVIVAVVIVVVLVATGGKGKTGIPTGENKVPAEVASLLGGIPQAGNTLGKPTAPVTLEYFGDLECSICQKFTLETLPTIIRRWVRPGDLRIEYHSLETATREPETFKKQQVAAYAAGAQQKAWYFIETFYHEQGAEGSGYVNESYLDGIARQVSGLNLAGWQEARSDAKYSSQVEEDAQIASNEKFTGTPSFLIARSGGASSRLGEGLLPESTFNEAIQKLLKS